MLTNGNNKSIHTNTAVAAGNFGSDMLNCLVIFCSKYFLQDWA
ncbi:hypothetical protein C943_01821 [Mariniradius saccharolyticus AK6]|uniref:Uncharacterized protein n=1 Tax=Mariniradius saccharolyticus AK6 TaxID=1239962 RepID=M7XTR9_9BACT|nr:hypothetical protein C943_01821 [Mariniradius saccharolyticus AK6]